MNSIYHFAQFALEKFQKNTKNASAFYLPSSSNPIFDEIHFTSVTDNAECQEHFLHESSAFTSEVRINDHIKYLPIELLDRIFENLDINETKNCRLVCKKWDQVLSSKRSFIENLCVSHGDFDNSFENRIRASYIVDNGPPLKLQSLRLRHLYFFWSTLPPNLFQWMNIKIMSRVTWLEIQNSQLKIFQLLEVIQEFPNLKTLRVSGDTIFHISPTTISGNDLYGKEILKRIEHLHLHFEDLHNFLLSLETLGLLQFRNLKTLDLKGSTGNASNLFRIEVPLLKILNMNAKTLQTFKLDNFDESVKQSLDSKLSSSKFLLRSSLYAEFPRFLLGLNWNKIELPNLQEISFQRFPIANMNEAIMNDKFVPFLLKQKNIRQLSFAQLYFSQDLHFEMFVQKFPSNIRIKLISVHLYAPNPNLENITQVMHPEHNITKYQNSSVGMYFLNIDWTIIYCTWSSIAFNPLLQKYTHLIRKLHLKNVLFSITDEEMQFIVNEAKLLQDLNFECCDLSKLTDSGITGLSVSGISKILANDSYEPISLDYIGKPIQNLTALESLKLSNVGGDITHVSLKSFSLMRLRSLTIHQLPMMIRPMVIENFKFSRNIIVEYKEPELDL